MTLETQIGTHCNNKPGLIALSGRMLPAMFIGPIRRIQVDLILRTKLTKASIVFGFVTGVLLSQQLWLEDTRFFPILKPFEAIPVLSSAFNTILMLLFVLLCAVWIFYEKKIIGWAAITSLIIILLQDQMRWQPWVYLYLLMLLPYLLQSNNGDKEKSILLVLQWILAGVYVWGGINKLNPRFLDITFTQVNDTLGLGIVQRWKEVGYVIPILETSVGLALLTSKFRRIGIYLAIATHIMILFYLSPIVANHNSVVYPWNVIMIVFVCLLFMGVTGDCLNPLREIRSNSLPLIPVILVWAFPLLTFVGYWDHFLSFSLYSDRSPKYYIAVEQSEVHKLDNDLKNYFVNIKGLQGGQLIDVDRWAFSELNVPFYPETRVFKKLSSTFCELDIAEGKLIFLELSHVDKKSQYKTFTCNGESDSYLQK